MINRSPKYVCSRTVCPGCITVTKTSFPVEGSCQFTTDGSSASLRSSWRAVDHSWHISQRNHAGRDLLELEPADHHWLEQLDKASRREIQKAFERCRKQRALAHQQREQFAAAIEHALAAYDDWRLNRA